MSTVAPPRSAGCASASNAVLRWAIAIQSRAQRAPGFVNAYRVDGEATVRWLAGRQQAANSGDIYATLA
jgi:hypothetical protein